MRVGQVARRVNESRKAWIRRTRIAQAVEKYGLRVICSECGEMSRHRPAEDGHLMDRRCERCSGKLRRLR